MSELEKQIEQWRADLAASEALGRSDVDELEGHLREQMERLTPLGLSETEAFLVARQRLGETTALQSEYAKVNTGRRFLTRLSWMAGGAMLYLLGVYLATGVAEWSAVAGARLGMRGYWLGGLVVAVKSVVAAALLLGLWALGRHGTWDRLTSKARTVPLGLLLLLLVGLAVVDGLLVAGQITTRTVAFHLLDQVHFTRMTIVMGYATLGWRILAPILAGVLAVVLWARANRYPNRTGSGA
jgi:hypothetical protein